MSAHPSLYSVCNGDNPQYLLLEMAVLSETLDGLQSRKFKGGICRGGHLAVTYGGELLYLRIFS